MKQYAVTVVIEAETAEDAKFMMLDALDGYMGTEYGYAYPAGKLRFHLDSVEVYQ